MTAPKTLLLAALAGLMAAAAPAFAADAGQEAKKDPIAEGKEIAFDRKKGNCLACHMIEKGEAPGTIAPPLIEMKLRFPEKEKLRAQIFDATTRNPNTVMPPFGRHQILSEEEINKVVEFVHSL